MRIKSTGCENPGYTWAKVTDSSLAVMSMYSGMCSVVALCVIVSSWEIAFKGNSQSVRQSVELVT